ncbi:protein of unknown function [Methanoculleus bourgensis]|uniref:Uncharacterized protein n=1 Tax=Methanoculleus bourgensis TaxID=83986 RepID=A0A0X3BPT3_9EURY|nr:protein of unknown function [Methanoculleus bourgensis]
MHRFPINNTITSACCHLTLRDLPSLFATFAASRETSVLSITPHAEERGRARRGVAGGLYQPSRTPA